MLQTSQVVRGVVISDHSPTSQTLKNLLPASACISPQATVEHLESLNRKELLELFCFSKVPANLDEMEGEWNALLLENNGIVMTKVSNIMTHVLFGMGRRWNGKLLGSGKGSNRFLNDGSIDRDHPFDVSIEESRLHSGKQAGRLKYAEYQSSLSPWKTMVDEVRYLGDTGVMIGFGSMAWSGGMLNAAPFCLWRSN